MDIVENEINLLKKGLKKINISLETGQVEQFLQYYEIMMKWNSFMNLTAITEFEEVVRKHYIDSASLIKAVPDLPEKPYTLIDVGTGAGFPGIPLKILFPDLKITLLDSLNKRVKFLKEVIEILDLKGIEAVHGRAEDYARPGKLREFYDLCVSRAVADLSVLAEYCIPFVKKGGCFVAYKSESVLNEFANAENAIKIMGGRCTEKIEFELPDSDIKRILFLIGKIADTPLKYPRKSGVPSKEPIM